MAPSGGAGVTSNRPWMLRAYSALSRSDCPCIIQNKRKDRTKTAQTGFVWRAPVSASNWALRLISRTDLSKRPFRRGKCAYTANATNVATISPEGYKRRLATQCSAWSPGGLCQLLHTLPPGPFESRYPDVEGTRRLHWHVGALHQQPPQEYAK